MIYLEAWNREIIAVPIGGMVPYEWEVQRLLKLEELHRERDKITPKWEAHVEKIKQAISDLLHAPKYPKKQMLTLLKAWDEAILSPHRFE